MAAGNLKVTVNDNYGCVGAIDFTLNQPEKTSISWSVVDNVCYGEAKGKINVTAQAACSPIISSGPTIIQGLTNSAASGFVHFIFYRCQ
jgi:hypothetical protein